MIGNSPKHKLWNILYQLRQIYSICMCCDSRLSHTNWKFAMGKWKWLFHSQRQLTYTVNFYVNVNLWRKDSSVQVVLFILSSIGYTNVYAINIHHTLFELVCEMTSFISRNMKLKDMAIFFLFSCEAPEWNLLHMNWPFLFLWNKVERSILICLSVDSVSNVMSYNLGLCWKHLSC